MIDRACEQARGRLLELADAEQRVDHDTEVTRHLAECEQCRLEHAELISFDTALRQLVAASVEVQPGLDQELDQCFQRVTREYTTEEGSGVATTPTELSPVFTRAWFRVAALLLLLLCGGFVFRALYSPPPADPPEVIGFEVSVYQPERAASAAVAVGSPYHLRLVAAQEGCFYVVQYDGVMVEFVFPMYVGAEALVDNEIELGSVSDWDFLGYDGPRQAAGTERVIPAPEFGAFVENDPGTGYYVTFSTAQPLTVATLRDLTRDLRSQLGPGPARANADALLKFLRNRSSQVELQVLRVE